MNGMFPLDLSFSPAIFIKRLNDEKSDPFASFMEFGWWLVLVFELAAGLGLFW